MGSGAGDRRTAPENAGSHQAAGAAAAGGGEGVRGGGLENYESSGNLNEKGQHWAAQRLLVVTNRLPVSAIREGDSWDLRLSPGGICHTTIVLVSFRNCSCVKQLRWDPPAR
ncbi:unnamed protein product [Sphagnum jensenii]|uniref:Uncharacterized protein n=1 Tax=Sphagnum jensenii TaxID=128206 RepID=A0ABP0XEL6_9BRYO